MDFTRLPTLELDPPPPPQPKDSPQQVQFLQTYRDKSPFHRTILDLLQSSTFSKMYFVMHALDNDYLRSCLEYIFNSILRNNNPVERALGTIVLVAEIVISGSASFDHHSFLNVQILAIGGKNILVSREDQVLKFCGAVCEIKEADILRSLFELDSRLAPKVTEDGVVSLLGIDYSFIVMEKMIGRGNRKEICKQQIHGKQMKAK